MGLRVQRSQTPQTGCLRPALAMLGNNRTSQPSPNAEYQTLSRKLSNQQFFPIFLKNSRCFVDMQTIVDLTLPSQHCTVISPKLLELRNPERAPKQRPLMIQKGHLGN